MAETRLAEVVFQEIRVATTTQALPGREQIIRLRTILDHLCQEMTRGELRTFSGLFNRLVFLFDRTKAPEQLVSQVHRFRRDANQAAHTLTYTPTDAVRIGATRAICELTAFFTQVPVPRDLQAIYAKQPVPVSVRKARPAGEEHIDEMSIVVRTVKVSSNRDETGRASTVARITGVNDDGDDVTISLWNEYAELGSLVWQYATLLLLDIKRVTGSDSLYSTTDGSLVVIEPDYLVSASSVAEAFQHADAVPYVVQRMVRSDDIRGLVLGMVANECFDLLMEQPQGELDEVATAALRTSPKSVLAMASSSTIATHVTSNLPTHFATLKHVVSDFTRQRADFTVEPTYLSPRYGIQGRLDALVEYPQEPAHREVVELKSSKLPGPQEIDGFVADMWPNNFAQTVCYNMLLEAIYPDRRGQSSILYSADSRNPLRNAPETRRNRKRVLMARNRIVAAEHQLQSGDVSTLQRLTIDDARRYRGFMRGHVAQFASTLASLTPLERAYFFAFMSYVAREQWLAKVGTPEEDGSRGFASLWRQGIDEKKAQLAVLADLYLVTPTSPSSSTIRLKVKGHAGNSGALNGASPSIYSNFREGDIGILYPLEADGNARPWQHQLLKGTVVCLTASEVEFKLNNRRVSPRFFEAFKGREWVIEHDTQDTGFDHLYESLFQFASAPQTARNRLLGIAAPRFDSPPTLTPTGDLRPQQTVEVGRALSARDYYLLQAPPGTGKTTRIVRALVEHLVDCTHEDVLILAYTNRAVDEICSVLEELNGEPERAARSKVDFLRLGRDWNTDHAHRTLGHLIRHCEPEEAAEQVQQTRVIVSTVHSFMGMPELLRLKRFGTAIVDEASQLLEPYLVGPLSQVQRFILIGDQKQLPAVTALSEQESVVRNEDLKSAGFPDLRTSLYERLWNQCSAAGWDNALGRLTQQARMHETLQAFPSEHFYLGRLEVMRPDRQRQPIRRFQASSAFGAINADPMEHILGQHRLIFVPTAAVHRSNPAPMLNGIRLATTKVNVLEANRTAALVQTIANEYGASFEHVTVGVITPWRAQAALIKNLVVHRLGQEQAAKVTIDTVERFQGSSREIIIVSFCINQSRQIESASDLKAFQDVQVPYFVDRKLNVALTRAREHLILLGRRDLLSVAPGGVYRDLLEHIDHNGYVCTEHDCLSLDGIEADVDSSFTSEVVGVPSSSTHRRWWPFGKRT